MRLHAKGRIALGLDADMIAVDDSLQVQHVMARGRWHVRDGQQVVLGSYETQFSPG
jgi:beta-aspartyl-dipeptidase (metallo-type)